MASDEDVEKAVLEALNATPEPLPKTIIDELQRKPEFTDTLVSEAIWRLVESRRVELTKTLRLRFSGAPEGMAG
jgi:hypothetical protein